MKWETDDIKKLLACRDEQELKAAFPGYSLETLRRYQRRFRNKQPTEDTLGKEPVAERKTGIQSFHDDNVVVNWSTGWIWTNLGEYGDYSCTFTQHGEIQRAYATMFGGKHENQEQIARRFGFRNANAVARYMRYHGIRHSSIPQSDIEIQAGMVTEEGAVEETLAAFRNRVYKKTQAAVWAEIQSAADKWNAFDSSVLTPLVNAIRENGLAPEVQQLMLDFKTDVPPFAVAVGPMDLHYPKFAFGPDGRQTYGREQALEALRMTSIKLIERVLRYGKPSKWYMAVGSDNMNIDTLAGTTTRGTPQDTEGVYETILRDYIEGVIQNIEMHRLVAPVEIEVVWGNHDKQATMWLGYLLEARYRDVPDVTVNIVLHPRVWRQYGRFALGFTHGEPEFLGTAKKDRNVHKLPLVEARQQGVDLGRVDHIYIMTGNLHFEEVRDYGMVTLLQFPSLSGDDRWHKENAFEGTRQQTTAYVFDEVEGLINIIHAVFEPQPLPK